MTIDDIKNLVSADESRTLELKKTTGELKDGMHSACAFLNTEGGWLIFGIAPKSLKIIGQDTAGDCPGIGRTGTCSRCAGGVY